RCLLQWTNCCRRARKQDVYIETDKIDGETVQPIIRIICRTQFTDKIPPLEISKFTHSLLKTRVVFCQDRSRRPAQNSDPPHLRHLRPRRHRPSRRAPKPRDELPPSHSITSSARSRNDWGIVRPSALAVLRRPSQTWSATERAVPPASRHRECD